MADNKDITTRFKLDISDFKKNITDANNQIKLANSEFKAASNGTKEWEHSVTGVQAKIKQLKDVLQAQNDKLKAYSNELNSAKKFEEESKNKVEELRRTLEKAKAEYGENSDEVKKLERELLDAEKEETNMTKEVQRLTITMNNQQGAVNRTEASLDGLENELEQLENAENSAENATDDLSKSLKDTDDEASNTSGFTVFKGMMADLASNIIMAAADALKDFAREIINVGREFDAQMSKVQAISGASGKEFDDLRNKAKEMGASTKFTAKESAQAFEYMAMAGWKPKEMLQGIKGIMDLAAASGEDLASTSDIVTDGLTALGLSAKDAGHFSDVLAVASSNSNTNVALLGETFKYAASVAGSYGYKLEDVAWASGVMANAGIKGTQAGTSLRSIMSRLATDAGASSKQLGALGVLTKKLGVEFYDSDGKMRSFKDVMEDTRVAFKKQSPEEQAFIAKKIAGQNAMSGFLSIMNATTKDTDKLSNALQNCNGSAENMANIMNDNLNGDMTTLSSTIEGLQQNLYDKFSPALRVVTQEFTALVRSISNFFKNGDTNKEFEEIKKSLEDLKPIIDFLKNSLFATLQILVNNTVNSVKLAWNMIKSIFSVVGSFFKSVVNTIANVFGIVVDVLSLDFKSAWDRIKNIFSTWGSFFANLKNRLISVFTAAKNYLIGWATPIINAIKRTFSPVVSFFSGILNKIKSSWINIFNSIKTTTNNAFTYIRNLATNVANRIKSVWNGVKTFFIGIWNTIKNVFSSVSTFFSSKFSAAVRAIKSIFNPLVGFFSDLWSKIKSKFSSLGTTVGSAIGGGVKMAINGVLRLVENTINSAIGLINGAIGAINKLPGVSVGKVSTVSLPRLAQGGILRKGQVGLLEGDGSEAVVPLDQNRKWISALSKSIIKNTGGYGLGGIGSNDNIGNDIVFNQTINSPKPLSRYEIYKDTKKQINLMRMVMQNG